MQIGTAVRAPDQQCAAGRRAHLSHETDLFEQWYEQHGANIAESVKALRELEAGAEGKEAYERLAAAVQKPE